MWWIIAGIMIILGMLGDYMMETLLHTLLVISIVIIILLCITYTTSEKVVDLEPTPMRPVIKKPPLLFRIVEPIALVSGIVLLVMYFWSWEVEKAD